MARLAPDHACTNVVSDNTSRSAADLLGKMRRSHKTVEKCAPGDKSESPQAARKKGKEEVAEECCFYETLLLWYDENDWSLTTWHNYHRNNKLLDLHRHHRRRYRIYNNFFRSRDAVPLSRVEVRALVPPWLKVWHERERPSS